MDTGAAFDNVCCEFTRVCGKETNFFYSSVDNVLMYAMVSTCIVCAIRREMMP